QLLAILTRAQRRDVEETDERIAAAQPVAQRVADLARGASDEYAFHIRPLRLSGTKLGHHRPPALPKRRSYARIYASGEGFKCRRVSEINSSRREASSGRGRYRHCSR